MRRHDLISGTISFIFGFVVMVLARRYDLGSLSSPGPGFMPFLSGLVICGFSVMTIFTAFLSISKKTEKVWTQVNFRRIIATVLILIAYAILLDKLGFIVCAFLLVFSLMRYVGSGSWLMSIFGATLSSGLSYLLFATLLRSQLPKGIIPF